MTERGEPPKPKDNDLTHDERFSREVLLGVSPGLRRGRRILRRLPSSPRCKFCASPFRGAVGPVMRLIGKGPWPGNPKYCAACFTQMVQHRAGAEVECSLLFADVRDSTPLAERIGPRQFRVLMDRFFETASQAVFDHDGIVDKFVGDEVIGIFIPGMAGDRHAAQAIAAGRALLAATGNDTDQPWVPVGAGVNTGVAFVGTVGQGDQVELTALGDPVNVTARLASAAGRGELLVSVASVAAAHLPDGGLEHRSLALKGKSETTDVVVLHASA
jgi:adenylate cyclase